MHVREDLWLPEREFIEGRVCLELFDARTGKLQERVKHHNYVADTLVAAIKAQARGLLTGALNHATSPNQDWPFMYGGTNGGGPCFGFWLTDATTAADQTNDRLIRGNVCAWSYLNTYTGSDAFMGTMNVAESSRQSTKEIAVIDWPTNAGNGTISSVYLATFSQLATPPGAAQNAYGYWEVYQDNSTGTGFGDSWADDMTGLTGGANLGLILDPDGLHYWEAYTSPVGTLVKRALGTGTQVATITLSGLTSINGITNDGTSSLGNWWVMEGTTLLEFPAAGGAATATYTGKPSSGSLCFGGGHVWCCNGTNLYQYDPATGNLVTTVPLGAQPDSSGGSGWSPSTTCAYMTDATDGDEIWVDGALVSTYYGVFHQYGRYSISGNGRGLYQCTGTGNRNIGPIGFAFIGGTNEYIIDTGVKCFRFTNSRQFFTRALLPSPVTKSNTQTMKLTYEFDYS